MNRGDQLTVAHLLEHLHARGHEVDLFTLDSGGWITDSQGEWLRSRCREVHVIPHGGASIGRGLATALLHGLPLQVGYFMSKRLARSVERAIHTNSYDVVYNYYFRTAYAIPKLFGPNRLANISGKVVASFLAMQLSQTLNTRRIYEAERNWLKRLFYRIECNLVSRYESVVWQRFTKSVLIGPRDVEDVAAACRASGQPEISNYVLIAHGTDIEKFKIAEDGEVVPWRVVFSGNMQYQPNVQAAMWFVENCWSAVRQAVPGAELYIVGHSPVTSLRNLNGREGIVVTGSVPSIADYIRTAAVCVNPVFAAGGMQNKLIEYMACGKAIVATTVANEGIRAPDGTLAIADEPTSFSVHTIRLLQDASEARHLGKAARAFVERYWTWQYQFERLENAFYEALDSRPEKGV